MSEYDDIARVLGDAAEVLPDAPDRWGGVTRKRSRRLRRRGAAVVSVLVLTGAGVALGATSGGGGGDARVVTPAEGGAGALTATGRVVQVPGKPPRFCASVPTTAIGYVTRPAPAWCQLGVDVRGVDLAALANRYEKGGAVEGDATLTGHLDGDVLVLTKQEAPQQETPPPFNVDPPCTPPAGGWRVTGVGFNPNLDAAQAYVAQHPADVAAIAVARPSDRQAVPYLLTWGDPSAARAALQDAYGDQLCVLASRWTKDEVAEAVHELTPALVQGNGIYTYGSGQSLTPDGQLLVDATAVRSTPELEAMVARHPAGLVKIDYWLHPVSRSGS